MSSLTTTKWELIEVPSTLALLWRVLAHRGSRELHLPPIEVSLSRQLADKDRVVQYNRVCGFTDTQYLAPIFPHVLAFPVHLMLMTHRDSPFPLLGLIHLANRITYFRPIAMDESLNIVCRFGELAPHARGTTFTVLTSMTSGTERVWEGVSTLLYRHKVPNGSARSAVSKGDSLDDNAARESWYVPSNIGRLYARVSGDRNPIHLYPLAAKLFGFPRAIAHGMWSKAHCVAALTPYIGTRSFTVDVTFKSPILLPTEVIFMHKADDAGLDFQLRDRSQARSHLIGNIRWTNT